MSTSSSFSRLKELLPELFKPSQIPGDRYLRFQLTPKRSALISMTDVQESLLVSGSNITCIPNMSISVMGLMSSRDHVFCVIDLAHLIGIDSLSSYLQEYHVIVLNISKFVVKSESSSKELLLGIAVNQVEGITRVISEKIQYPDAFLFGESEDFLSRLNPYLKGCILAQEEPLLVFNTQAIVNQTQN